MKITVSHLGRVRVAYSIFEDPFTFYLESITKSIT